MPFEAPLADKNLHMAMIQTMPEGPRKRRPRDASQLAKLIVDIALGEVEDKPD